MAFWSTCLYFETYILDFKLNFDNGLQLVNGVSVFNGFLAHLMAIFKCFRCFNGIYHCFLVLFADIWHSGKHVCIHSGF